ncbi:MAG: secondary thiamine-phosphate synthase enzyme YjbQ [Pseudomonadota bacterium]
MPKIITIPTRGPGLYPITDHARAYLDEIKAQNGLLSIFLQHTSASLTIQENADPDVLADLVDHFERLAPADGSYRHAAEGPDDMPAHIKTALTDTALSAPVIDGGLGLGVWQGIYVFEHRRAPQRRRVVFTYTREG